MNTKAKAYASSAAALSPTRDARESLWVTTASSLEERVQRIESMGQRITGYIQFMCQIAGLSGTSAEAKERGVTAFYERMVVVESQLRRIHEELRLE